MRHHPTVRNLLSFPLRAIAKATRTRKASLLYGLPVMLVVVVVSAGVISEQDELGQVFSDVAEIRGLAPKNDVALQSLTSNEIVDSFGDESEEEYYREQAAIEHGLYVLLDLMGEDQDLHSLQQASDAELTDGFYNFETGELFVVTDDGALTPSGKVTAAHEYTHALQDQHFDMDSLLTEAAYNSDLFFAIAALIEGDASLVDFNYELNKLSEDDWRAVLLESEETGSEVLVAAPRFVEKYLSFPYEEGLDFVAALGGWDDIVLPLDPSGWERVNEAYKDPPQSTEQILHSEKYLERDEPQDVIIPDLEGIPGPWWTPVRSDVLGEFGMRTYLETFVAQHTAESAAEGWDGDRYVYLLDRIEGEQLLVLRSTWDSEEDAGEFYEAYTSFVLVKSRGAWESVLEDATRRHWTSEDLSVYLSRNGSDVLIIIAPDVRVTEKTLVAFPEF